MDKHHCMKLFHILEVGVNSILERRWFRCWKIEIGKMNKRLTENEYRRWLYKGKLQSKMSVPPSPFFANSKKEVSKISKKEPVISFSTIRQRAVLSFMHRKRFAGGNHP